MPGKSALDTQSLEGGRQLYSASPAKWATEVPSIFCLGHTEGLSLELGLIAGLVPLAKGDLLIVDLHNVPSSPVPDRTLPNPVLWELPVGETPGNLLSSPIEDGITAFAAPDFFRFDSSNLFDCVEGVLQGRLGEQGNHHPSQHRCTVHACKAMDPDRLSVMEGGGNEVSQLIPTGLALWTIVGNGHLLLQSFTLQLGQAALTITSTVPHGTQDQGDVLTEHEGKIIIAREAIQPNIANSISSTPHQGHWLRPVAMARALPTSTGQGVKDLIRSHTGLQGHNILRSRSLRRLITRSRHSRWLI